MADWGRGRAGKRDWLGEVRYDTRGGGGAGKRDWLGEVRYDTRGGGNK